MIDSEKQNLLKSAIGKYYEFSAVDLIGESLVFRIETFDHYPEQYFDAMVKELDKLGFLAFTNAGTDNEIVVVRRPELSNNLKMKVILFIATVASVFYFGYTYQVSYSGLNNPLENIAYDLVFFVLPISVILAGREVGKYVALKKNGMSYSLPIFVPDPLGIGTMGIINTPNRPYISRKAMVESGSYSLIFGFLISIVFLLIGSFLTFYFPPMAPIVNTPAETIGTPLIMQFVGNRLIPSNGILDPLAFAGWIGIVTTSLNALPLGFLDGGIISSTIMGRRAIYFSYLSIMVIIGLGILYPPWIILAVFALLVGLRGPQALNNITKIRLNTKMLVAISFTILLVGIAPFPFHASANKFQTEISQQYFVVYSSQQNINFNISVNNIGQSTIVPAFEITPTVSFILSGASRTIAPGKMITYTLEANLSNQLSLGFNHFYTTVYSGSYSQTLEILVLDVNLSNSVTFNNNNPYNIPVKENETFNLTLKVSAPENVSILSMGGPNLTFSYFVESHPITLNKSIEYLFPQILVTPSNPLKLSLRADSIPSYWYIVAYDGNYNATYAKINVTR
jgi:membrane-associated protease RseP (regulator of RpoE activity)